MAKYVVVGGRKLEGRVAVGGAKNAALKHMAAALLGNGTTTLSNVPNIEDVKTMAEVLARLGMAVEFTDHQVTITPGSTLHNEAPYELVRKMRASVIVLGPLVARLGAARVALPGGCNIGSRKIDLHIAGLEALGTRITVGHGYIEAETDGLCGTNIFLDFPSVGATENLLMAACLAKGRTLIENAAREPEIADLADFLNQMGARICGAGTSEIEIEGVSKLSGAEHHVIPDRIEAGTFMTAAAISRGHVVLEGARAENLGMIIAKLRECGVEVETIDGRIIVDATRNKLHGIDISTLPYPGFATDMQPQFMALLATAKGTSFMTENVFESRFMFVDELIRMGADIRTEDHQARIKGVPRLSGAPVRAPDLRAGAALVIAGLSADGITEVGDIHHIDRGYEGFDDKLRSLGAEISRVGEKEANHLTAVG
ncbi:MAG: UDP-N-acetylglucosamine 1-carboxyvinyltransferase [Actinobacteria bacterium]|jgi:UDP-N-acetylglucosamine 1-carboxyvinyltransferase|nr:MAG: UDP-N-acetylglucosamine 1-carboxyvinyltransferase [Actinomycetota bacterium]